MRKISSVREPDGIILSLVKRGILKQYLKAKEHLLSWRSQMTDLKQRKPKMLGLWQFRITRKYRAMCSFKWDVLHVFEISDHQE